MKKILSLIVILSMLLGVMQVFAETEASEVDVNLASGDITINGTKIDNSKEAYPFVSYKGITYFPMTWDFAKSMGLSTSWTAETGLKINKSGSGEAVKLTPTANNDLTKSYIASVSNSKIEVEGNSINNALEDYPLLNFRSITYFPMTWRFMVDEFGTDYSWYAETGLNIASSDEMKTEVVEELEEVIVEEAELEETEKDEDINVPNIDFKVLADGTIIVEATFDGDYLRENMYGISDYIGVIEAGIERQSLVMYNKNDDWHGYYYDIIVSFYDRSDNLIYDYNAIHGSIYFSEGVGNYEAKMGLYNATEDYSKAKITMKLYSPELFNKMNDEIASEIDIEYIHENEMNQRKLISDGGSYFQGVFLYNRELSTPYLSAYGTLHNRETLVLDDGSIKSFGLFTDEIQSYHDSFYMISEFEKIEDGNVYMYGEVSSFGTNGDAILMLDENYKPIKIYINLDAFKFN